MPKKLVTAGCGMWAIVKGLTSGVQRCAAQVFEGWVVNVNQSGMMISVRIMFSDFRLFYDKVAIN